MEGLPIITERLIINRFYTSDAPFVMQLMNEPLYIQNIGDRNISTVEEAEEYIKKKFLPSYDVNGFGYYIIRLRHMDFPIGSCGLFNRHFLDGIDIGYAFLEDYHGMGYAYEAASAVMSYAANTLELSSLIAVTDQKNTGSRKLLKRLGFKKDKTVLWSDGSEVIQFYNENLI